MKQEQMETCALPRTGLEEPAQDITRRRLSADATARSVGAAILDRIRVWLPVLIAISTNSPFRYGADSGYASYRPQAGNRWPTAGPCGISGSAQAYHDAVQASSLPATLLRDAADPSLLTKTIRVVREEPDRSQ